MTFENVKSTILTLLVLLSLFFTWKLWTFQPDYALLKHHEDDYIESDLLGETRTLPEIVFPEQVIIHYKENSRIASPNDSLIKELYDETLSSKIDNIVLHSYLSLNMSVEESLEFVLPTNISFDILLSQFNVEEALTNLSTEIERVVLYLDEEKETVNIRFISFIEQKVIEATTNLSYSDFTEKYLVKGRDFPLAINVQVGPNDKHWQKDIYLPKDSVVKDSISYTTYPLSIEVFKNLLFSDPDSVKYFRQEDGDESYTDGNRMISLLNNRNFMEYINPIYTDSQERGNRHIIISGHDFINGHGGWTDEYRLFEWTSNSVKDEVSFRLMINDLPVILFNGEDILQLHVTRTGSHISRYTRPLFELDRYPIDAYQQNSLLSGEEILTILKEEKNFQFHQLEKITVGYEMKKQNAIVTVEPHWFMLYEGKWQKILQED